MEHLGSWVWIQAAQLMLPTDFPSGAISPRSRFCTKIGSKPFPSSGAKCRGARHGATNKANPMTDPWDERYIYIHEWLKFMVNVGNYTMTMNPMGMKRDKIQCVACSFFICSKWIPILHVFCLNSLRCGSQPTHGAASINCFMASKWCDCELVAYSLKAQDRSKCTRLGWHSFASDFGHGSKKKFPKIFPWDTDSTWHGPKYKNHKSCRNLETFQGYRARWG